MRSNVQAEDRVGTTAHFASDDAKRVDGEILCIDDGDVMPVRGPDAGSR